MAAGAPFRRAHSGYVLHVLDALAIPLIVERREMMRGAGPLLVNVRVAALAGLRLHEIFRGNVAAIFGLRGAGEKLALRSVAFAVHGRSRHSRVRDAVLVLP